MKTKITMKAILLACMLALASATNVDPSEASAICATEDSDGILVAHENCNQFYKCSEGLPAVLQCQDGLLYKPNSEWCDWPANVDCGDRIIPEEGGNGGNGNGGGDNGGNGNGGANTDPSEAPQICAAEGSDGILVAHENCNQFYKCSEGLPAAIDCQEGLLYKPENEWCDWPANVDCGDRNTSGGGNDGGDNGGDDSDSSESDNNSSDGGNDGGNGNTDSNEASSVCANENDGTLVAHENCNQFYTCSGGVGVVFNCQEGLLYNADNKWCDWPANVDCGDRVNSRVRSMNKHFRGQ